MADPNIDPAVAVSFAVEVDGKDLGAFMSCDGLGFDIDVSEWKEGGNQAFIARFPGRIKWGTIKLTRAVTKDSAKVAAWVAKMSTTPKATTASIRAMTSLREPVVTYWLAGVIPVKWTGPQLSADSPKVATETLELIYDGFQD